MMFAQSIKLSNGLTISKCSGKMDGIPSISTNPLTNKKCMYRNNISGCVCEKCYSVRTLKARQNVAKCYQKNSDILIDEFLTPQNFEEFNNFIKCFDIKYFRFESHGDVQTSTQLINYIELARHAPSCNFALWTKNKLALNTVYEQMCYKPTTNLNIVYSSPMLNECVDMSNRPYINNVFTVFTREYQNENNIKIQCGSNKCINCLRCYKKHDKQLYTNELLK